MELPLLRSNSTDTIDCATKGEIVTSAPVNLMSDRQFGLAQRLRRGRILRKKSVVDLLFVFPRGNMGEMAKKKIHPKSKPQKQPTPVTGGRENSPARKIYSTTGYSGQSTAIVPELGEAIRGIESQLNMPVWLMLQADMELNFGRIDRSAFIEFRRSKEAILHKGEQVALVIDSPGGDAHYAFLIAKLLRRHCGGFVAVVPSYAKSAATLLALGADRIFMGEDAQLGPLDAQIHDIETEEMRSVLEYVQSLERLEAFSLRSIDDMMHMLLLRTGKKVSTVLPHVMQMVSSLVRPLFENVDVVQYTQMARVLKVAEDYAVRLLRRKYRGEAETIARALVSNYADHGVVIDQEEAGIIGLKIEQSPKKLEEFLNVAAEYDSVSAWGKLVETTA